MTDKGNGLDLAQVHTVSLVSCVKEKLDHKAMAKDLYISPWFKKARAYVEKQGGIWFILSAKYGLVASECEICPYCETLNDKPKAERRAWAARVREAMEREFPIVDRIVVLAGERYREFLMDYPRARASTVEVPMEHLKIGKQLSWLGNQIDG